MIIICTGTADTYITDKIIDGNFRAKDANVGQASTLDLFKLYNETKLSGTGSQLEVSRALMKFDLNPVWNLTGSILDIRSSKFNAKLVMKDVMTGHAIPRNFTLSVFPLSQSFDEGEGMDTGKFSDVHVANFLTASYTSQNNVWFLSGANRGGLLDSVDIDYISSGNLLDGSGVVSFEKNQTFTKGPEDLSIDITPLISATIAGQIHNHGFRLSYTSSEEEDAKTRFVKRFASRHVANPFLRPRIEVRFDDTIQDNHQDFYFDTSGTLFLNSFVRSSAANLVSGSSLTDVAGSNCFVLHLNKGLYNLYVTGSQHTAGSADAAQAGVYSASFAIASNESTKYNKRDSIAKLLREKGEVEFTTYWNSVDGTVTYHTGSVTIKQPVRKGGQFISREPQIVIDGASTEYHKKDTVRFRLWGNDLLAEDNAPVRGPYDTPPVIFEKVYYQVVDRVTEKIILAYDDANDSTRVSTDSDGMFFDFKMQSLYEGRSYAFDFYIVDRGSSYLIKNRDTVFVVKG